MTKIGIIQPSVDGLSACQRHHPRRDRPAAPQAEAVRRVKAIPGIGTYSAGLIVGRTAVPIDVWSVVTMSELLLGRTPETPQKDINTVTEAVNERWGEWSWMAFVYVINDLPKLATLHELSRSM